MSQPDNSSALQRCKDIADIVSKLALPVVIAIVGGCYNSNITESANRVRYVELAIAQLRTAPSPETSALREWSIAILKKYSPIELSKEAVVQMRSYPIALSGTASGAALATGTATLTVGKANP